MDEKLQKPYQPAETENRIYTTWEESGFFNPDVCLKRGVTSHSAEPFSMVFPPANVTGVLHLGHALTVAIQDIIIRFRRMQGYRTLYIPGTDHAAIATQAKVEAELYKGKKKTRRDFSQEEFLRLVEQYAAASQTTILNQLKRLGASVDWSRLAYTLDDKRTRAVRTAFTRLFELGLIYRGSRLVNWDPKLQTNVSDDEIEWKEETTNFYYLKYGPFVIGTARPETKFGDKYVVMNPKDPRYRAYTHGQKIDVEWINGPITATVIKDGAVDMEFGTGVMTMTPAHDAVDYDIATKHGLDIELVIDLRGCLLPVAGEFSGQHISKARTAVVKKLEKRGLLERVEPNYTHRIATNSRGGGIIEPQIREQWFITVEKPFRLAHSDIKGIPSGSEVTLKRLMRHVVESGQIKIIPDHFAKTYFHWIDNLRDWCISRQIVFGHQIPVWYRGTDVYCGITPPTGEGWQQDTDTLDTWFSSGLWTFSTLGWPEDTADFTRYHPNAVMETGYDILFFWVARMILMSGSLLGQIPFRTVYLHGLVRNAERQKMSKSKGTIIDPLEVIGTYGTDALRFALVYATSAGTDMAFTENRVKGMKHFINKLWNIARFVNENTVRLKGEEPELTPAEKAVIAAFEEMAEEVTNDIETFRFYRAAEKLYHYLWHTFADVLVEESKLILRGADAVAKRERTWVLRHIFRTCLILLHPFIPFVTEELWRLSGEDGLLMVTPWPVNIQPKTKPV